MIHREIPAVGGTLDPIVVADIAGLVRTLLLRLVRYLPSTYKHTNTNTNTLLPNARYCSTKHLHVSLYISAFQQAFFIPYLRTRCAGHKRPPFSDHYPRIDSPALRWSLRPLACPYSPDECRLSSSMRTHM